MFKKLIIVCFLFLLFMATYNSVNAQSNTVEGEITRIIEEDGNYQKLEIETKEKNVTIENGLFDSSINIKYKVGDNVVVTDGMITDYVRRPSLLLLLAIFLVLAIFKFSSMSIKNEPPYKFHKPCASILFPHLILHEQLYIFQVDVMLIESEISITKVPEDQFSVDDIERDFASISKPELIVFPPKV